MEIQGSTEEHEHPDHGEGTQGNEQDVDHHTQLGAVVYGQRFQHSHLLQDHHGTVGEQEAVPRDVEAVPDAAVPVALPLGGVEPGRLAGLALDGALPGEVLHVHEELGAQVPHGRAHQQRAQAPQHQQRALGAAVQELAPGQLVRGEGDEGQQQPQRPSPGHLHEVSARGKAEETQARVKRHSNGASGGGSAQGQCSEPSKLRHLCPPLIIQLSYSLNPLPSTSLKPKTPILPQAGTCSQGSIPWDPEPSFIVADLQFSFAITFTLQTSSTLPYSKCSCKDCIFSLLL